MSGLLLAAAADPAGGVDSTTAWTFVFVTITFMLYLYIGWRSRVKETQGFYVAGRGVPAIANGAATAADWMSAASFISMAGMISFLGYDGSIYLMGWTGGYVLLALLLAPYLRKFGKYTVPDFVGERYYSETARVVAAICAVFVSMTYVAGQMRGVGIVFSRFLQVDVWQGVLVGMVIVAFFAVLGGMKGITWTQVVQYFVLILAFLIPALALSKALTGWTVPQLGLTFSDIGPQLNALQTDLGFREYTQPFVNKTMLDVTCITFALMVGTAGLPHVIVRFYTVPDVRSARFSAGWALLFIAILYTTAPALAVFARQNMLQSLDGARIEKVVVAVTKHGGTAHPIEYEIADMSDEGRATAYREIAEARSRAESDKQKGVDRRTDVRFQLSNVDGQPIQWVSTWQKTSLITFDDKNHDGRIQLNAVEHPKTHKLMHAEANIDRDIVVLSTPEVARLAPWVIALVATGGLAAALSTAAGLLLVISSSIAHDLYIHFVDPKASEAKRVAVGRIMIVAAIVIAGYFGINPPGFVAQVVAFAFGLAAASFFPIILLGIFDKRTNREGAVAGMVVGIAFTALYILGNRWDAMFHVTRPDGFVPPWYMTPWIFHISAEGIGAVGCLLNFVVTIVVSRLTPPPPNEIQQFVEQLRIPRGARPAEFED